MSALGPDRPEYGLSRGRIDRGRRGRWTRGADASRDARDGTRRARPREAPQPMARARYGDLDPVERSAGCSCRDPETRLSFSAPTPQRFQDARHTACFVSAYFRERGGVRVLFIKVCENEGCRRASFCGKNNSPLQEPPVQPLKKGNRHLACGTSNNKFITTRAPGQARVGLGTSHSSRGGTAREHARDRESTNNFTRVTPRTRFRDAPLGDVRAKLCTRVLAVSVARCQRERHMKRRNGPHRAVFAPCWLQAITLTSGGVEAPFRSMDRLLVHEAPRVGIVRLDRGLGCGLNCGLGRGLDR